MIDSHPFAVKVSYHAFAGYISFCDSRQEAEQLLSLLTKALNDGKRVVQVAADLTISLEGVRNITIIQKPEGYNDAEWMNGKITHNA